MMLKELFEVVSDQQEVTLIGDGFDEVAARCSECDNCDNPSYIPGNYCWFCGAKMDGGEDGENEHEV